MGYITYDRQQWRVDNAYTGALSGPYKRPPIRDFSGLPKSSYNLQDITRGEKRPFRPSRLVRVKDMKVVKGAEVDDDYCALSYSWNQSGDLVKKRDYLAQDSHSRCCNTATTAFFEERKEKEKQENNSDDEFIRVDQGKHTIIDLPARKIKTKLRPRGRRRSSFPPSTRLVKFESLVQQICIDFGVQYIWYDQMCIDQNNPSEKKREMKQMHRIYYNAMFSVVLVPELQVTRCQNDRGKYMYRCNSDAGINTEWCRRAWCLEEMVMSKLMLYVARNTHMWSDTVDARAVKLSYHHHYYFSVCVRSLQWAACTALYHAHRRLSTKPHDRVFALANIFPETMNQITFSYNQPILNLMMQFYCSLVKNDIRILLFGTDYAALPSSLSSNNNRKKSNKSGDKGTDIREQYAAELPSWVGMNATHMPQLALDDLTPVSPFNNYNVCNHSLVIEGRCISATLLKEKAKDRDNICYQQIETEQQQQQQQQQQLFSSTNSPSSSLVLNSRLCLKFVPAPNRKPISPSDHSFENLSYSGYYGLRVTHQLPIRKTLSRCNGQTPLPDSEVYAGYMSLTKQVFDNQESSDSTSANSTCITILSEIAFSTVFSDLVVMPVVQKAQSHYKSIGVCFMHKCVDLAAMEVIKQVEIQ